MNNNHPSREKGPAPPVQPKEKAGQDLPQNIPAPPETDTITNTPDTPSDSTLRRREWQPPSLETLLKRYGTDLLAYLTLPDAPTVSDPDLEAQFRFQHRGSFRSLHQLFDDETQTSWAGELHATTVPSHLWTWNEQTIRPLLESVYHLVQINETIYAFYK